VTPPGRAADLLLVAHHPADAELARRLLRPAGWRRIAVARDGDEALAMLQGPSHARLVAMPRLVLLDPDLPGLDGFTVLERIRQHPVSRAVPVVVFTTSSDPRDIARSYRLGANGVMHKPVDFDRYSDALGRLSAYWLGANAPPP
jgi:two-component system, response regulator